jgi:hypothetical protein
MPLILTNLLLIAVQRPISVRGAGSGSARGDRFRAGSLPSSNIDRVTQEQDLLVFDGALSWTMTIAGANAHMRLSAIESPIRYSDAVRQSTPTIATAICRSGAGSFIRNVTKCEGYQT